MNFNLQRHIRLAGTVALLIGFFMHSWGLFGLGLVATMNSYMWSISKIEQALEAKGEKDEEA